MTCLEEVCRKNGFCFQTNVLGNTYCTLSLNRRISCGYIEGKKDQNGFYPCKLNENYLKLSVN